MASFTLKSGVDESSGISVKSPESTTIDCANELFGRGVASRFLAVLGLSWSRSVYGRLPCHFTEAEMERRHTPKLRVAREAAPKAVSRRC